MAKAQATPNLPAASNEQLPDFLREYQGPMGTETIDSKDVNMPRLKLGQSMTPEVKDKVCEEGDFIHNITREIVIKKGEKAVVIPICFSKQFILWRDRKDGGGIMARANRVTLPNGEVKYRWDKPNTTFTHKLDGKTKVDWKTGLYIEDDGLGDWGSEIPGDAQSGIAATAHHNYVLMLPEHGNMMVAISLSKSQARKAKDLNAMLKMGNAPIFARRFHFGSVPDQNNTGDKYFNVAFAPAGFVQDKQLFDALMRLHNDLKDKGINVDFSDEDGGKAPAGADAGDKENF